MCEFLDQFQWRDKCTEGRNKCFAKSWNDIQISKFGEKNIFFWKNVTTNLETKGEQIGRKINGKAKLVVVRRKMMYTILLQTNREFCVCVGAYCNNVM